MKLNITKLIYLSIVIQILSVQGIITFNIFKYIGNWEFKSLLHPLSLILLMAIIISYRIKKGTFIFSKIDVLFILYSIVCVIFLIKNTDSTVSVFLGFREVFLIMFLIIFYQQIYITSYYWNKILKLLYLLVIANLFFVLLTHILGPEEYMKILTGRYRWGNDTEYKFKISSFLFFWRSPGLIGSPGNVGYFGLLTYLIFDQDKIYKRKSLFPMILAIVGFVRSVYVILIVYWTLKFILTKKNLKILKDSFKYIILVISLLGYFMYLKGVLNLKSLYMRIDHWVNDITVDFNIFFGLGIGKVGGAVRGEGFIATLDNYWLFMLISTGLIGTFLLVLFLYEKSKGNRTLRYALLGFLFAGLFVTLTQSISFLVLFPLLFLINNDKIYKNETY